MNETFKTFTMRVMGPAPREEQTAREFDRERGDVAEILRGHALRHVEYTIDDMLPEGWYAKIEDTP